jgi:RHS repeat-associated protein
VLVALRNGTNLRYVHQDSLGSTSVVTNSSGAQYGYTRYYPYGSTRDSGGSLDTDKKFTGQRLDGTGLYYYGARYYDPTIGRFISPDTTGQSLANPQSLNRYSYCLNNPLKYTDPTGHWPHIHWKSVLKVAAIVVAAVVVTAAVIIAAPVVLTAIASTATAVGATTVAATATTAAVALAPVAATVAAVPVLGTVATAVAGVGLEITGLGGTQAIKNAQSTLNPPGALGTWSQISFQEGDTFQRVGSELGKYGAPVGQSADASALFPNSEGAPSHIYQFNTSWKALQSIVAPQPDWNRGGLGIQYYFQYAIKELLKGDIISKIAPK